MTFVLTASSDANCQTSLPTHIDSDAGIFTLLQSSEIRIQKSEFRNQNSEIRIQTSEFKNPTHIDSDAGIFTLLQHS